jgi:hypothetical protein
MYINTLSWYISFKIFNNYLRYSQKRSRNFVSFIHALLWVSNLCFHYPIHHLYNMSVSYYIYDNWYIIRNKVLSDSIYFLHHIICILSLHEMLIKNCYFINHCFTVAEVSNMLTYIVYDQIKTHKPTLNTRVLQFFWFFYFRIVYFSYLLYSDWKYINTLQIKYGVFTLYILGFVWCFQQAKKLSFKQEVFSVSV